MKNITKYLLITLFVISLICNALLSFYLLQEKSPLPSIIKIHYDTHDTVIYCERSDDVSATRLNHAENSLTIGELKLLCADDSVYLINSEEKIKLSDYEGFGFIINSDGDLLYSMNTPVKKQETVYITPSGKKYHKDRYCAGTTGFEISLETAKILREACNLCA